MQSKFPSIKDLLQTDKVAFFVHRVSTETNVDVDERPEMASEPLQVGTSRCLCYVYGYILCSCCVDLFQIEFIWDGILFLC